MKMTKEDKKKMSFISKWGAFGLCNVLVIFQKLVIRTFKEYPNDFMQVLLYDFNVYG
jgi:hypothetical protein